MSRKKKALPVLENITIEDIAAEGKSIVRWNDMVVFVPFCVPGDVVDLQIKRKKHSYAEAEVIRFHKYSDIRIEPEVQAFRSVWRMQMAAVAIRGAAEGEAEPSDAAVAPHWPC